MNTTWSEFLASREINEGSEAACALNDLSHYGLIRVEGEDAASFLQGQLTNDLRQVTDNHSNLAGWCSAKGRMLANFRCFRRGESLFLQTPEENLAGVIKRLRMFVLRAKVSIEDASDELMRLGISGDCAADLLAGFCDSVPAAVNDVSHTGELTLIRLPGDVPRFEAVAPAETLMPLWRAAEDRARRMGRGFWALQEIHAGIPTIFPSTSEAFVPQMTNMHLIDGVSFTKGCYVGQEVVARMQYLGKLKRRMYLARVESDIPPAPGDELFARGSTSGQGAGKVVDAQAVGAGYELLAVIEVASAEEDQVTLGENGPKLSIANPPYPFLE